MPTFTFQPVWVWNHLTMDDQPHDHHRLLWAPVLSLAGVLGQYTVNLLTASMLNSMASAPTPAPTSKNAMWTDRKPTPLYASCIKIAQNKPMVPTSRYLFTRKQQYISHHCMIQEGEDHTRQTKLSRPNGRPMWVHVNLINLSDFPSNYPHSTLSLKFKEHLQIFRPIANEQEHIGIMWMVSGL